jgi:hypothetical protein
MTEQVRPNTPPQTGSWYGDSPFAAAARPPSAAPANQLPAGLRWQPTSYAAAAQTPSAGPRPLPAREAAPLFGTLLASVGLVLLVLAFSSLTWFSQGLIGTNFGGLHALAGLYSAPDYFAAYFDWLGVTLLLVSVVGTYAIKLISPTFLIGRVAVLLLALAGAVTTFTAPLNGGNSFSQIMSASDAGYWCAVLGFMIVGVGAAIPA